MDEEGHADLGSEGQDVWLLCENVPVLVSAQNLRPATDAEALAHQVLNDEPVIPDAIARGNPEFEDHRDARADVPVVEPRVEEEDPFDEPLASILEEEEEEWKKYEDFQAAIPIHGQDLSDLLTEGRGFWKKVNHDALDVGLRASRIFPAFYYHVSNGRVDLVLTTHVDDFLWACTESGQVVMDKLLSRFEDVLIDVTDNTTKTTYIDIQKGAKVSTFSYANKEAGDKIRAVLAEMYGHLSSGPEWYESARKHVPHVMLSDCRSLVDHLNVEVPARVQDKRLQIELNALRQAIFLDDGTRTVNHYPAGGDRVDWCDTATQ
ncbi:ESAG8, partial [Symbiodinium pilosum]